MAIVIKVKRDITPPSFERNTGAAQFSKLWNVNALNVNAFIDTLTGQVYISDPADMKTESDVPKVSMGNWCLVKEKADADNLITHIRSQRSKQHKAGIRYEADYCYSAFDALLAERERAAHQHAKVDRVRKAAPTAQYILRGLEAMLNAQDEPDFIRRPTDYAYDLTRVIIEGAYTHYVGSAPVPTFAPDGDGGIRVEWQAGQRIVRLVVPDSEDAESYVYNNVSPAPRVDKPAMDLILARRLRTTFAD